MNHYIRLRLRSGYIYLNLLVRSSVREVSETIDSGDDVVDTEDDTRHTLSFGLSEPVTARHVAFAVGPFERVNLASARNADDEEKLG